MTSIFFQGINPTIPTLIWWVIILVSFGVAWWSYSYLDSVKPWKKWALVSLRAAAFAILALLLLNPFFIDRTVETSKPTINIYLDNSQSVSVERGEYDGLYTYNELLDRITAQFDDRFDTEFFLFDSDVRPGREVEADGSVTNIQSVIDHMAENQREFVASLLFSDGIYTQGRNPIFMAQTLSNPIYTVPVGDTTTVQDVVISNIEYNPVIYTNTEQQFRVDVRQDGFAGETAEVQFLKEGELIDTEEITFPESTSSHLVIFSDSFDEEGFIEYEINIPGLDGEFTLQNNRERFTIEVIDEKTKIVSIAFEVHPDVASIRRLIATDSQNELHYTNRLSGDRLTGIDPRELESIPDLIVLHGLPAFNDPLLEWIGENSEVPVIYFLLPSSQERHVSIGDDVDFLTYTVSTPRQSIIDAHLYQERDAFSHPLLEFSPADYRRFPVLKTFRSEYSTSSLTETLFSAEFQREETGIPIIMTESTGTRRLAGINAFGWHRFEITANENVREFYERFFTDIISWAATSPDHRNLNLEPVKPSFTETEEIEIRASLVNERQEPERDATIELRLDSDNTSDTQTFLMRHTGNGNYRVSIGNLPEGTYTVEGTATKADREIGNDQARFTVSRSMVEFVNTQRDDELLEQLSIRTEGEFLGDYSLESMFQYLSENNLDQPVETTSEETRYLSGHPFWFIMVILILTGEWILRRTISLP